MLLHNVSEFYSQKHLFECTSADQQQQSAGDNDKQTPSMLAIFKKVNAQLQQRPSVVAVSFAQVKVSFFPVFLSSDLGHGCLGVFRLHNHHRHVSGGHCGCEINHR